MQRVVFHSTFASLPLRQATLGPFWDQVQYFSESRDYIQAFPKIAEDFLKFCKLSKYLGMGSWK